jgi:hypothetical protein
MPSRADSRSVFQDRFALRLGRISNPSYGEDGSLRMRVVFPSLVAYFLCVS